MYRIQHSWKNQVTCKYLASIRIVKLLYVISCWWTERIKIVLLTEMLQRFGLEEYYRFATPTFMPVGGVPEDVHKLSNVPISYYCAYRGFSAW